MAQQFAPGDVVFCRGGKPFPGIVEKVGRKYVHVDWGAWKKPMLPTQLIKPKEVAMPGLSGDGITTTLIQTGGEDFPAALTWAVAAASPAPQ